MAHKKAWSAYADYPISVDRVWAFEQENKILLEQIRKLVSEDKKRLESKKINVMQDRYRN